MVYRYGISVSRPAPPSLLCLSLFVCRGRRYALQEWQAFYYYYYYYYIGIHLCIVIQRYAMIYQWYTNGTGCFVYSAFFPRLLTSWAVRYFSQSTVYCGASGIRQWRGWALRRRRSVRAKAIISDSKWRAAAGAEQELSKALMWPRGWRCAWGDAWRSLCATILTICWWMIM